MLYLPDLPGGIQFDQLLSCVRQTLAKMLDAVLKPYHEPAVRNRFNTALILNRVYVGCRPLRTVFV